jgi:hypothetical protein
MAISTPVAAIFSSMPIWVWRFSMKALSISSRRIACGAGANLSSAARMSSAI